MVEYKRAFVERWAEDGKEDGWRAWMAGSVRVRDTVEGAEEAMLLPQGTSLGMLVRDWSSVIGAYLYFEAIKAGESPEQAQADSYSALSGPTPVLGLKTSTFELKGLNGDRFKDASLLAHSLEPEVMKKAMVWMAGDEGGDVKGTMVKRAAAHFTLVGGRLGLSPTGVAAYVRGAPNRDLHSFVFEPLGSILKATDVWVAGVPLELAASS